MKHAVNHNFSPGQDSEVNTLRYLCILEKTPTGYSGFAADFDLVLATGRTKEDVLNSLAQELQLMQKGGELSAPKSNELEFLEEDVELAYVAPASPNLVSAQLEKLMRSTGKKQKEVSAAMGVSSAAVSRLTSPYYHGHSMDAIKRFANALGYEVELKFKKVH